MKLVKVFIMMSIFTITIGCTSLQVATKGTALITNYKYNDVFTKVLQTVNDCGFSVENIQRENGFILATRSHNNLLTSGPPTINIFVLEGKDSVQIDISAIIHGQVIDYGTTKKVVEDFCKALLKYIPEAKIKLNEQEWVPNK